MEKDFWIKVWNEGKIGFHRSDVHEKLTSNILRLSPKEGQTILVPLCGKSKDMLYLRSQGLNVRGIELSEIAAQEFFQENQVSPVEVLEEENFKVYSSQGLAISCGDFFKLQASSKYDFIYDRASLVALPKEMRVPYAKILISALKSSGKYLLITYEFASGAITSPPHSVDLEEVHRLFGEALEIELISKERPLHDGPRMTADSSIVECVYLLTPRS